MEQFKITPKISNFLLKLMLSFCLLSMISPGLTISYAQSMNLEGFMDKVTQEVLQSKQTADILKKRTNIFKELGIVGKNAKLIMAGFEYDRKGKGTANIYAYLYHDKKKPSYYCLVMDNFGETTLKLNSRIDEYLFKNKKGKYSKLSISRRYYQNGDFRPLKIAYVDLGFNDIKASGFDSFIGRINSGKTFLYLKRVP